MLSRTNILIYGTPVVVLILGIYLTSAGWPTAQAITLAVTLWCAVWWIFEPVPIPFTSLLPLAIFPLLGVLNAAQVAQAYGHWLILLLMGGFMISAAMAKSGAHRRIALQMLRLFGGTSAIRLVLGFMVAAAILSMWISNTATTLMLLPVALAVLEKAERQLAIPLLLGVAYGASVGGIGTPIGTPPNLIFMSVYNEQIGAEVSFIEWMSWGLPVVIIFIPLIALWLTRGIKLKQAIELPHPGRWRTEEKRVMLIFGLTAAAWVTRTAPFGGWRTWLELPGANDASVALLAVALLAIIPNGHYHDGKPDRLLDWKTAQKIPWGVLLLFSGGLTIAAAFVSSGLADTLAGNMEALTRLPPYLLILGLCLTVTFLTEVTSNTATTSLLMPVLAATALATGIDPKLLMIPAALSASCAFMLPVATAPNAIIFGSGQISVNKMAREGFVLNLIGAFIISTVCYFVL
ncbi:MAG: SLC13 family permease [Xanthomonadales bacterium]|nr:SLC13 family permease [Xanthomonadales bacterium]